MEEATIPERPKAPKTKKEKPPKQPKAASTPKPKRNEAVKAANDDPQSMFKVGFLSEVYRERSIESGAIQRVITRVTYPVPWAS